MSKFVRPGVAEVQLGVNRRTLLKWADAGAIKYIQPGGEGERRYDVDSLNPELAKSTALGKQPLDAKKRDDYIYVSVESSKSSANLQLQIEALQAKHKNAIVIADVADGLDFDRDGSSGGRGGGLKKLLELARDGKVETVFVGHCRHLGRFTFGLFQHIFALFDTKVVIDPVIPMRFTEAEEIMSDVQCVVRHRVVVNSNLKRKRAAALATRTAAATRAEAATRAAAAASSSNAV